MNNKILIFLCFVSLVFTQCTKKNADMMSDTGISEMKDNTVTNAKTWRSAAPSAGPARNIELGEYSSFDLDNGLKVIVVENHKLPRVSYQISLNNDALVEGDMAGYVSMAGDQMSNGTKNRTKAQIDEAIDFIGASLNTSSGGIFGSSLTKHQGKLLDVMTDVLYNPIFPQAEFDKAKTQTLSGLASAKTDPSAIGSNVSNIVNYGANHPYGEVQTEETVNNITLDKVKEFYNTYYKPNNAYLIVVGDTNLKEVQDNVRKYFGNWKKGVIPSPKYEVPAFPTSTNVHFANKDGAVQSVIRITYPIEYQPGNPDAVPASVMNSILGGGIFSGRLMQNLREDKAYTYGARSQLSSDQLIGNFSASASVRNEVTDSSITEFLYEMRKMVTDGVTADDLQLAKNSLAGGFARSLESPQTIARFARNTYKYNLPKDYYNTYLSKLEAVSQADFEAMAKKYIRAENANIIVVGSKDDVADKLNQFDADGKLDYYDAYGNKLVIDDSAMIGDITVEEIISNYIEALGGKAKLMGVTSMKTVMVMNVMGQDAETVMMQKGNNKMKMVMSMGGNVMQETIYDGSIAAVGGMGGSQKITEGPQLESIKEQAEMFGHLKYATEKTMELKGIEDVNGEKAYKLSVVDKEGKKSTEYFSMSTGYLLKVVSTQGEGEQLQVVTTELSEYKPVDGVMVAHKIDIIGAAPFPLNMKVTEVMVNKPMADTEFLIK
ncbi:insulinase family protein [Saprospiraceae bacterium]|nr:insulinase family protein [Saprospiraceae bacterium]